MEAVLYGSDLKKFLDYDPGQCAAFETYLDRFLRDTLLSCQMREEEWSLSSLSVYKGVRLMAAIYAKTSGDGKAAIDEFMQRTACTKETAEQYLKTARGLRSRQGACFSEDSEEDVACIDSGWRVSEWVWDGIRANAIQKAFWKLSYRDQILLERRSAICMGCGRVGSPSQRYSYEQLSALIQAGTDKAAERAYKRAVKRLETSLIASKAVRLVKLKCVGKAMDSEKIVSAVYRYQADCDGEWGEIHLDFKQHCGEIRQLADWDTTVSHVYASEAIRYLFRNYKDGIPDEATVPFDVV